MFISAKSIRAGLDRVLKSLEAQSYATHGCGSFQQWYQSVVNAREIIREAKSRVTDVDIVEVVVIDMYSIEHDIIKSVIRDEEIQAFLPFKSEIVAGENYFHIINDSGYIVETKHHFIPKGATICARGTGKADSPVLGPLRGVIPTCPGCVAKSKNIIATHVLDKIHQ